MLQEIFEHPKSFKTRANAKRALEKAIWDICGNDQDKHVFKFTIIATEARSTDIVFSPVVHLTGDQTFLASAFATKGICVVRF